MTDPTEMVRRQLVADVNSEVSPVATEQSERWRLEHQYGVGNVWSTNELSRDFEVIGFMAPFCVVRRKADGQKGSVMFQHHPRFYFNFEEYNK